MCLASTDSALRNEYKGVMPPLANPLDSTRASDARHFNNPRSGSDLEFQPFYILILSDHLLYMHIW